MNDTAQFALVHQMLVHLMNTFMDSMMKTAASVVIAIGWILTSESSRAFFADPQGGAYYYLTLTFIVMLGSAHAIMITGLYLRSQRAMRTLAQLDLTPRENYAAYEVTLTHLILVLAVNLTLFAVLFLMIAALR